MITEFNNYFIIRSASLFFHEYPREAKRSAIFMQEQLQEGEKRGFFYAWVEKIFCSETRLDEVAHEQVA